MIRNLFFVLAMTGIALAGEVRYDCLRFVEQGLASDPQMEELRYGTEAKKNKIKSLKSEVILPTFFVELILNNYYEILLAHKY